MQPKYVFILLIICGIIIFTANFKNKENKLILDSSAKESIEKVVEKKFSHQAVQNTENLKVSQNAKEFSPEIEQDSTHLPQTSVNEEINAINFSKFTSELYASKERNLPRDELANLKNFETIITPYEKSFFNAFQARLGQSKQTLRINITFNRDFKGKGSGFCLAKRDDSTGEILEYFEGPDIKLLRSDAPGYIVVFVKGKFFLQIFATTNSKPNKFKSYYTNFEDGQKLSIVFEQKPTEYDGTRLLCEDFW